MVRTNDEENGRRVKRLLQMMFLLQESEPRSSEDLAKQFKVSRRTIFRDIQVLRDAGIPVEPGEKGAGYYMIGSHLRCVQLQPLELIAVACADAPEISHLSFLRQARVLAFAKLACASDSFSKAQVQHILDRLAELQVNAHSGLHDEGAIEALVESWIKEAMQAAEKPPASKASA